MWQGLRLSALAESSVSRQAFGKRAEQVIAREPKLLAVDLQAVLAELRRLMPRQSDPLAYLASHPRLVLDMQSAGKPADCARAR